MILFTIRLEGKNYGYEKKVWGYIEPETVRYNELYFQYYLFGKYKVWSSVCFTEFVPLWAYYQDICLGSSDWLSKRPKLINACLKKRLIKTIKI